MNSPVSENAPIGDPGRWRVELARKWASSLATTAYLPLPHAEVEERLLELVDRLAGLLKSEPFAADRAAEVGTRLVDLHCTGPDCLRCTMEVLGKDLLSQRELQRADRLAERVVAVLGALASGYTEALRLSVFAQQEGVDSALVEVLRQANLSLRRSEARFDELFHRSACGAAITDLHGNFVRTNEALHRIFDRQVEELAGHTLFDMFESADAAELREAYRELAEGNAEPFRQRRTILRGDEETALVSLSVSLLDAERPDRVVIIIEDQTELALLQDRLSHQSLHDMLTGLPNRQFFGTRLEKVLRHADPATGVTLYHLDLDAFSMITDGLSKQVGDRLLCDVADKLTETFAGEQAMVARLGADEFGVVVENSPDTADVVTTVGRINEALAEPVYVDDHGVAASATVGVVDRPPLDTAPDELLRAADMTLRRARNVGRRQWGLFDQGQDARDRESYGLAASMPGAWENGEIRVVYQPIVWLSERKVVAVEALLQWDHGELGTLPHERCVALAEETGLILPMGAWLMRTACERIATWDDYPIAISLSPSQSQDPDLVGSVLGALDGTGLPRKRLLLAMPLRELVAEHSEAAESLKVLSDLGVQTAVLDFDGGPGDLACLEDLPARAVLLARRIVACQTEQAGKQLSIAQPLAALVDFVHSAGMRVVVGDVSTKEQVDWWQQAGADLAVGPVFTPSSPAADIKSVVG